MGSPISGTMAEVFLQQLENSIIKHLIDAKMLSFYTSYVDDIFLIYDSTRTNPDNILQYIDTIHSSIQLNPTMESNDVNFLDLTITKDPPALA
jgi:magnesium-transporting ATPase (P-type)